MAAGSSDAGWRPARATRGGGLLMRDLVPWTALQTEKRWTAEAEEEIQGSGARGCADVDERWPGAHPIGRDTLKRAPNTRSKIGFIFSMGDLFFVCLKFIT